MNQYHLSVLFQELSLDRMLKTYLLTSPQARFWSVSVKGSGDTPSPTAPLSAASIIL